MLASDVSRSVDTRFELQREGYAAALSNPRVIDAISSGPHGKIAICFVEWSGATSLKLVIDWTVVSDAASARKIGDQMLELPRSFADRTSISAGLEFPWRSSSARGIRPSPHHRRRRRRHQQFGTRHQFGARRDSAKGVTINGLVILGETPLPWNPEHANRPAGSTMLPHQRDRRSGSFAMVAENDNSFGQAIVKKMIAEIAWRAEKTAGDAVGPLPASCPRSGA